MKTIEFGRIKKDNPYSCFSNFYECKNGVTFDGLTYRNSEAAWQAQKTLDVEQRKAFTTMSGSEAKKAGRKLDLRPDWDCEKLELMRLVCKQKFVQNPELKDILLNTGDVLLVENTTGWHDNFWGKCNCDSCKNLRGLNWLGRVLGIVRENLRGEQDEL